MQDNPVVPIGGIETILVIKVSAESANQFGELVADPVTNELLHYTGKPDTFEQSLANVNNMMQMKTKHRCGSKSIPVRVYSSI
ncbi:mannose-1-phosphate guanyltransferase alpha-like isoform X2 [Camellia sinensis]|uniref:mannose-1-phosphate guanyltransferase alpha-like isoform X2 n=1 Tax=Camellia sinensis TaxID=4442 RepID=UPI001036D238|nr:mannose-1-phosphate guanyltransferase alpha-like isoform X2 [Camellia sinensis]